MHEPEKPAFDAEAFLASAGLGRRIVKLSGRQIFFSQGEAADSVFYLQCGRAKLTVISGDGKEATITQLAAGDFVGEASLASGGALHMATATAVTECTALKIERKEMLRAMHEEQPLSEKFIMFLLARGMRIQSDLVDQLFNSSEKRLARILVSMANFGELNDLEGLIPEISEESLAEMIGTPQSSVSFFMNRFRDLGFIDYDGRIRVNRALLDEILHDRMPGDNTATPEIVAAPQRQG
jgi:CRP/FNR family cyclic AMP-dependent transcriptional regulator